MTAATQLPTPLIQIPAHWQGYFQGHWENEVFPPEATPFHRTSLWHSLSEDERTQLAWGFVQLNAEIIIHLEQTLLLATRELARRGHRLGPAMQEFVSDELLHINAFRDFLAETPELSWPKNSLFLQRARWVRRWSAWLYKYEPLSVFLPGAKSEIYAVQYHHTVKRLGGPRSRWASLVHHHAIDEASHIEQDFVTLRNALASISVMGRARLYFATILSVLLTQLCLWQSSWALMAQVFPARTGLKRWLLTARFSHWVLWGHPAYPSTRKVFGRLLHKESDRYFKRFAFLGW